MATSRDTEARESSKTKAVSQERSSKSSEMLRIKRLKEALESDKEFVKRQRKVEYEERQHMIEKDIEQLNKRYVEYEREERDLNREQGKLTEYDKKRLRRLEEDIERDQKTIERRRKMEAVEYQRKLETDAANYLKEKEALEREERLVRRRQMQEEEEYLRRLRTILEPFQVVNVHTPQTEIHSRGLEVQSRRRQSSGGSLINRTEDRDRNRVRNLTQSEIPAQMRSLQKELDKRSRSADTFRTEDGQSQADTEDDRFSKGDRLRQRMELERNEGEGVGRERNSINESRRERSNASLHEETEIKQALYVTVDDTEASDNLTRTTNVSKKVTDRVLNIGKGESRTNIWTTLDKEIGEMDRWLLRLKEEKSKLEQRSENSSDFKTQKREELTERHVQSQLDSADIMERDIKKNMRSTPKYSEERELDRHNGYTNLITRYDAFNLNSEGELKQRRDISRMDKEKEYRSYHMGFVQEPVKIDLKGDRDRVSEREGFTFDKDRSVDKNRDRDDHLYVGGQSDFEDFKKIERLRQREERLQRLEEEFAVKEREMEKKQFLLQQKLEAKRKLQYTQEHEKEILLLEKKLKEKFQRMKEKERELELLEASLLEPDSTDRDLNVKAEPPSVNQAQKTENSEYREKQQDTSEEELMKKLLKDRTVLSYSKRSDRVYEEDSSAIETKNTTDQHKSREERITLEKNMFFPKFTPFSGDDNRPKGEASYEEWRYEVKCTIRDKVYSDNVIAQAIRKSLRGAAKREIVQMGPSASVEDMMNRLESAFGNVASSMSVLQEFFTASQKQDESVGAWALRLEEIMQNAIEKRHIKEQEKEDLLKDKFWRSLRNERLKNATRIDFRTISNFKQLVKAVRTEELSMKTNASAQQQAVRTKVTPTEDKTEKEEESKQDLMFKTLINLQKEVQQFNRRRGRGRRRYQQYQQGYQQQGSQQQIGQQQGNQNQGNQQGNQQQRSQQQNTQQDQRATQNTDRKRNLNM